MKLKEALEIGIDCGLETARECIRNIYIHAGSMFLYSEMNKELNELYTEAEELISKTNFTTNDRAEDLLDWINMSEYLTVQEMKRILDTINKQEGQNYPCSNQMVICGFFAPKEKWEEFCNKNKHRTKDITKEYIRFNDGEKWYWYPDYSGSIRGFRFYKIKVSCDINRDMFLQCIYPCCANYCKEIEWI